MRKYIEAIYTDKYKKYNYPGTKIIYTDCTYNTACSTLEKEFMLNQEKINIEKIDTDIFLIETKKYRFIIDEFAKYKNDSGIVVMLIN